MCIRDRPGAHGARDDRILGHVLEVAPTQRRTLDVDARAKDCLLYTSDAADERSSVDLGGRRIIKKKTNVDMREL